MFDVRTINLEGFAHQSCFSLVIFKPPAAASESVKKDREEHEQQHHLVAVLGKTVFSPCF